MTSARSPGTRVTRQRALRFIRQHGVVLESAKGLEPNFAEFVAGERISGGWWGHPRGHTIYELSQQVHDSKAVLTCTLAKGRITYIHRRLWPAFVRLATRFPPHSLDKVREVHLANGRHKRDDLKFPDWVPADFMNASATISHAEAAASIAVWLERYSTQ